MCDPAPSIPYLNRDRARFVPEQSGDETLAAARPLHGFVEPHQLRTNWRFYLGLILWYVDAAIPFDGTTDILLQLAWCASSGANDDRSGRNAMRAIALFIAS
ncbi:hypothetical protein, partial [Mesorhizobium sp.]|uniref:hypothetical protein n=1 Tax=Mesorhizobium sp. TaxID=1871066 RepID=UPI0025F4D224